VRTFLIIAGVLGAACSSTPMMPPPPDLGDPLDLLRPPTSCAYQCPSGNCPEYDMPYACPAMVAWTAMPHAAACGMWDQKYPAVVPGKCTATAPSGAAIAYASASLLPDGRRLAPAGSDWVFAETDMKGGLTTALLRVPGTNYVLTVDSGAGDHGVRLVDTTKIGQGDPVASYVRFADPKTLNSGIAFVAPDRVYVATNNGVVQALAIDTVMGKLALDDPNSLALPTSTDGNGKPRAWYVAAVAASPDGKKLAVAGVNDTQLLVYDIDKASPTYKQLLGSVDLDAAEAFGVWFDPNDAMGARVWVSQWDAKAIAEIDVSNPKAPVVSHSYKTEKTPEGVAFLDARTMIVAADLGDALSVIDRVTMNVTKIAVDVQTTTYGREPTTLAWDAPRKRLYATLSGMNAVRAFDVDTSQMPPVITPAGMLPTGFWPSGVVAMDDGSLVVSNMRGRGTGPRPLYFMLGDSDISDRMRGSIQKAPAPSGMDLVSGETNVRAYASPATAQGSPAVSCPNGEHDFPLPATNQEGASPEIKHVFLIVRENKAFDGIFGDFPNVEGEPTYTLKQSKNDMDSIWQNLRGLARQFSLSDNYYTDAIYSTQGHVWATFGRTNDFNERTWAISGSGRNARPVPGGGIFDVGRPIEGSLFDWLGQNQIPYDILGEIVGSPTMMPADHMPIDTFYPGGPFQNIGYNDLEKACHSSARVRATCDFGSFVYMTLPNDHTFGVSPNRASPESYCAVNDEATGMFIDALSHSPFWASSVVFITEDDPSQGGEHIDSHRTPLVIVSPWVKRGYVSKTHIDMASLHKSLAHFFGKPYSNALVASAALPFDLFTSTPDFTPYVYKPRTWQLQCGIGAMKSEHMLTDSWDFAHEDDQPGLDLQVTRWMRNVQMTTLSPELRAAIDRRLERQTWEEEEE
jgi:DNA-binding beta-propeller fold protein YncE